ncbi:MAG: hypothetical protein AB7I50_20990, partial [Vicinamibacterales bacterium]
MWWPGPCPANWYEGHHRAGATEAGTKWAIAEGEQGAELIAAAFLEATGRRFGVVVESVGPNLQPV